MLNPPGLESTASIVAEIEDTRGWKEGCIRTGEKLTKENQWDIYPNYILKISDCDRAIALSLHWESARERKFSLKKIDLMIEALYDMREALEEEQILFTQRSRLAKKIKELK